MAGLSLAHGLQKAGIPVHVFERDPTIERSARPYAMRVTQDVKESLKSILSPEMYNQLVQSSAEVGRDSLHQDGGATVLPAVDRTVLRKLLLSTLEGNVSFEKELVHYTMTNDGVTVHFKDGSCERGTILVGADGTQSPVRSQYLPDLQLLDTEGRLIWGKSPMSDELRQQLVSDLKNGVPDHISNESTTLIVLPIVFDKTNPLAPEDYVSWILCTNKSNTILSDYEFSSMPQNEAARLSIELTGALDLSNNSARLKAAILEIQDPRHTTTYVLASALLEWYLEPWEASRVTLVGDAIHPLGMGAGGGAALKDVKTLLRLFMEQGVNKDSIRKYENSMRERVKPLLRMAAARGHMLFNQPQIV